MSKYRTAQGRVIDMGAMSTKHEKVRAVGNMNVNARGDTLDSHNRVIKENTQRISKTYNKTVQPSSPNRSPIPVATAKGPVVNTIKPIELRPEELELEMEDEDFKKE
jgi:hypothetical protein